MLLGIALLAAGLSAPVSSISVEVTGAGRPMILIPGFVSSGAVWKGTVDHYKDRYECHVITVAGFAGVPPATPAGLQRLRDDIIAYAVAKKLGIRHETPQALLIRDGRVVWSASHFRVTANAVVDAIKAQG